MGSVLYNSALEEFAVDLEISAINHVGTVRARTKSFEVDSSITTHAGVVTALASLSAALAAISEADITRAVIRTIYRTLTGAVTAVGDVFHEGVMSLVPDDNSDKILHTVFSPIDATVSGVDYVVTAAVQTYLTLFQTGAAFALSDGEQISTDTASRVASKRTRTVSSGRRG